MPSKSIAGRPPNNSFKPSPLRGLGAGSYDSAIAVAATLPGLTQALGLTADMRPPIVLIEHGDVSLFASAEAAARYIEPVDIRNSEYIAYDSSGFLLQLVATEPVVSIAGYLSERPHQDQLEQALRSFVERASGGPIPAEVTSLEGILALCLHLFGYTE